MSRIIAVWGCPGSGKTVFCAKLAKLINDINPTKIICILTDPVTPALPVLFPNKKADEMYSIGDVLSGTEITQESILKNLVTTSDEREVGFLGYMGGESLRSYPEFSSEKANELLNVSSELADFVIIDCGSSLVYPIPFAAIHKADVIFRFYKPDLKSISFFASQFPLYSDLKYRTDEHIAVMCVTEQDLYLPIEEAVQQSECGIIIPYAREVKQQFMDGQIMSNVPNKAFNNTMIKIVKTVV